MATKQTNKYKDFWIKTLIVGFVGFLTLHAYDITGFFIEQLGTVLLAITFSFFLAFLCFPFLEQMSRHRIPYWAGILIIYLILSGFITLIVVSILPIVVEQFDDFLGYMNKKIHVISQSNQEQEIRYLSDVIPFLPEKFGYIDPNAIMLRVQENIGTLGTSITEYIGTGLQGLNGFFKGVTSILVQAFLVLTFTFFIVLDRKKIYKFFHQALPTGASKYIKKREKKLIQILHSWLKGQLILGLSIFLATYIGLFVLELFGISVEKKFALAFVAGCTEFIQYIGPILALIPALIVGLSLGWKAVLAILLLYLLIQRLENNILVPWVMSKSMNLPPFTVLVFMAIGGSVFGILGVIVAVPIAAMMNVLASDFFAWRDKQKKKT